MRIFILILTLFFSNFVFAENCTTEEQADYMCCEFNKIKNHSQSTRLATFDKSVCTLSVYGDNPNQSYRRFGFGSDGQVSVFMQPGGNSQKLNSSMSFLLFPFGELPTADYKEDGKIKIKSGSGQNWSFNSQTALPTALSGCDLQVSPKFSLQDSGVKIKSCKNHLVIETPAEVGGEYIAYPDKSLTIRDPKGKSCQVKNSDLYNHIKKPNSQYKDKLGRYYDVKLKYKTNKELADNLKKLCPSLDVSVLSTTQIHDPADTKRAYDALNGKTQN